jgi:hypothetical protein
MSFLSSQRAKQEQANLVRTTRTSMKMGDEILSFMVSVSRNSPDFRNTVVTAFKWLADSHHIEEAPNGMLFSFSFQPFYMKNLF